DLAAAVSSPDEIEILIGDGTGGFVPGAAIAASPHFSVGSPILADLNRDGVLDLSFFDASPFTFEGGNLMRVAKGRGDGTFDPSTAYAVPAFPGGLISLDANGDGRADLVFPHEAVAVCLFLGLGNGEFAPKLDFGGVRLAHPAGGRGYLRRPFHGRERAIRLRHDADRGRTAQPAAHRGCGRPLRGQRRDSGPLRRSRLVRSGW